jgi:hypothetical protein
MVKFCESLCILVVHPESERAAAEPAPDVDVQDDSPQPQWKMRVQAEAAAEWMRWRKRGSNPTRATIRPHLLKWCADNNVFTKLGVNPSDGYLRTHVLGGKNWKPPT